MGANKGILEASRNLELTSTTGQIQGFMYQNRFVFLHNKLEGRRLQRNVFQTLKVNYFQHRTLYPGNPSIKSKIETFRDLQVLKCSPPRHLF